MKKLIPLLLATIVLGCAQNANAVNKGLELEKLSKGTNEEKALEYYKIGKEYHKLQDTKNAIEYLTKAIELNPKLIRAYVGKAKVCGDMGDWKCTLDNYETVKKLNPYNAEVYCATSIYKTNLKDLDGAMVDIDKAISMSQEPNAKYYAQKAWVYVEKNDYKNAIKWTQEAMKLNPKDEYVLGVYTVIAYRKHRFEDVIKITNVCLKYNQDAKENSELLWYRAMALYQTGQKQEAIKQMEEVIKLAPEKEYISLKEKMEKGENIK